ncbi:N-acetyltransferase [uncultured Croceitalea sp.]|uniref:N-acetyltransferase n=1 Tax=uncultured Croceitalea sp. TaxID=1798908 RepID=UPI0033067CD7
MGFLTEDCTFQEYNHTKLKGCDPFVCGHQDLDDFFKNDCDNYAYQLLGKTYCFRLDEDPSKIVCAFTVSNDSVRTKFLPSKKRNKLNRKIPYVKQMGSYPSALIGRLGVGEIFAGNHYGDELMDFIKYWFIDPSNKTGCRYIVVDAYNEEKPISYYQRNGFEFLFDNETDEKKYSGIKIKLNKRQLFYNRIRRTFNMDEIVVESLKTRLMYFDLIVLKA